MAHIESPSDKPGLSGRRLSTACVGVGLITGLFSGFFGIGGGIVIIPLLTVLGVNHRLISGISLAAITPTAIVGSITYSVHGTVNVVAALLLAVGMIVGAQIGSWLLARVSQNALQWMFVTFLGAVVISSFLVVLSRNEDMDLSLLSSVALVVVGASREFSRVWWGLVEAL